jgi:ABC-2 type transport system ATP-binding protein
MAIVVAEDLTRRFDGFTAVESLDLEVEKGEIFGLLGPNGAGKSTLLKLLTGQLEPSGGGCLVLGKDPAKDPMGVKRSIGIVPEVESPPSFLTGREYLHFVGLIRDVFDIEKRTEEWIDFLGMREVERTPCKDLSKGTRQKLMFAAALVHEPPLVFLDEPFSGLDPRYQKVFRDYLAEYLGKGGTVFMCSHILEIAEKMCTRLGVISQGRIVALGSQEEIARPGEGLDAAFLRLTEAPGGSD